MVVLKVLETIFGVIFFHLLFGVMTQDRGVDRGAVLSCRWSVRLRRSIVGHISGSQEALWSIFLPLTPFLWGVNIRVTNAAAWGWASFGVVDNMWWLKLKAASLRRKGVISYLDPMYSPGRRRKKQAILIMSHLTWRAGSL